MIEEKLIETETSDSLQAEIDALQAKLAQKQVQEQEAACEKIRLPVANVMLNLNKFNTIVVKNITPPELAFLVAEHHKASGGKPVAHTERVLDAEGQPKFVMADPRLVRGALMNKYSQKKVTAMFPGLIPTFPLTFVQAVSAGLGTNLPTERMMDFEVQPMGSGPATE